MKSGNSPPRNRKDPETPAPEVAVEDIVDADPTLEWSLGDVHGGELLAPESDGTVVAAPSNGGERHPTPPPVIVENRDGRRSTPPPVMVGEQDDPYRTPPPRASAATGGEDRRLTPPPIPVAAAREAPMKAASDVGGLAGERARTATSPALPAPPPPPAVAVPSLLLPDLPGSIPGQMPLGPWPEALAPRPRKKRLKPWFEEVFDEDYLRTLPFMTAEQTLREVSFIRDTLQPPPDGSLLDVACGYGRHAIELAQRGLRITGLDLSLPLLIRAADESQRRGLAVNFVHADMREMTFESQFDGAYCMLSSFGYFDEETNLKVAASICRALKPGGRFLIDTLNRDYVVGDLPTRIWWEGDGCVVLEEVDFNFHTSRLVTRRSVVFQDGRQVEQDISVRTYSLHELGKLMRQAGFRVLDVSGSLATPSNFFGATSRGILMLCERPTS